MEKFPGTESLIFRVSKLYSRGKDKSAKEIIHQFYNKWSEELSSMYPTYIEFVQMIWEDVIIQ